MILPARTVVLHTLATMLALFLSAGAVRAEAPQKTFKNSLGMTFVLLPAGTFMMGSPPEETLRGKGETRHQVTLTSPFYMQTTEVTLEQWRTLMGGGFLLRWRGDDTLPVTKANWYNIQTFIRKLNAMNEGVYRLPTEAQWEYAARAGTDTAYCWGERIDCSKAMFANSTSKHTECISHIRSMGLAIDGPAPVKSYPPNAWGLYDMHGNVWEWVQDWFAPYTGQPKTDPFGPENGTDRVRRGGSWFSPGFTCRSANRAFGHPATRYRTTGFRLVRVMEE